MATKHRMLSILQSETLTIVELMERLQITRNAVMVPLRELESKGLVVGKVRNQRRVGKPALEYTATPGNEDARSLAYPSFASLLVATLHENFDRAQIDSLMKQVGSKMADQLEKRSHLDAPARLSLATQFADSLGAETQVEWSGEQAIIRSFNCPLGRAVRQDPCVCSVMASFFAKVIDAEVETHCSHEEKLKCKFVVNRKD